MLLLIPGPVTTHPSVRAAAGRDYAPWDSQFREVLARVSARVLAISGAEPGEHVALPLPGSGHFAIEAAIRTFIPKSGRLLVVGSGHYADRMGRLATESGRDVVWLAVDTGQPADLARLETALQADPSITHVGIVYSETSTGLIHDAPGLAMVAGRAGRRVLIDAISAFGALPLDVADLPMVDCVTLTSNKCLESIPGISFSIARIDRLLAQSHKAESWSLDLADLYRHTIQSGPGSHRFTPVAQAIAALDAALDLFDQEGGPNQRLARYRANAAAIYQGCQSLGLAPCVSAKRQGPIVVNIASPAVPSWDLQRFVDLSKAQGVLISNFFTTAAPSFRVGCIGAITPADMARAVQVFAGSLQALGIQGQRAA